MERNNRYYLELYDFKSYIFGDNYYAGFIGLRMCYIHNLKQTKKEVAVTRSELITKIALKNPNLKQEEIEKQLAVLETKSTAEQSIKNCGRIIITDSLEQAAEFANRKAPEHLELAMDEGAARDKVASLVHNYGSLFVGHGAAEVFGDYAAGLNHTLPTSGSARFTGGLSVRMFIKTVTTLRTVEGSEGSQKSATASGFLGDAEGLAAHAKAARLRLTK